MSEWDDLEKFEKSQDPRTKNPLISINKVKRISFSNGFFKCAAEEIDDNKFVDLFFSRSKNAILFKFEKNSSKKSYGLSRMISPTAFFDTYEIDAEKYHGKYIPKKEEIEGHGTFWVIYLDKKLYWS